MSRIDSMTGRGPDEKTGAPGNDVKVVLRSVLVIVSTHTFIRWPSTEEAKRMYTKIKERHGFPKCVGAIDGTHIRIAAPKENANAYINRKGYSSIQLQVTCDSDLIFSHCYCGPAGSVHDMRIFRLSNFENMLKATNFPDDSHLLGNSAYVLQKH
ncbi:putative nuclease HARBI1 [Prorops nasuta]|uniref:putative nuclease HARBI1 n=1 Tax=Prorops nasuta TaxID=863751 RepID=UPI0034CE875B